MNHIVIRSARRISFHYVSGCSLLQAHLVKVELEQYQLQCFSEIFGIEEQRTVSNWAVIHAEVMCIGF